MKKPDWLQGEAARFYQRHHKHCSETGTVNAKTADSFNLLCEIWGLLRDLDKTDPKNNGHYIKLVKEYQAMGRQFAIMPNLSRGQQAEPQDDIDDVIEDLRGEDAE